MAISRCSSRRACRRCTPWSRARPRRFRERRPFDAEGLYYLGKAAKAEGGHDVAREFFEQAVESVKVSPAYRRRYIQRWGELAEKEI